MGKIALIIFLICAISCVAVPLRAQEAPAETPAGAGEEETDIIAGKVTAVDTTNNSLTVADEAGKSYTLTATKEETSIWKGDNTIELAEVKAEDPIELEYYKNKDGKLVAIWIDVLTKEAAAPPAEAEPAAPAPAAAPAQ
jgi:hypothetical protein